MITLLGVIKMKKEFVGTVFEYEIEGYFSDSPKTIITDVRKSKNDVLSDLLDNYLGKRVKVTIEVVD